MNGYGDPTCSRSQIIASERPLTSLIEFALGIESERMCGYDQSLSQFVANVH
jgi:hypothetical protein